MSSADVEAIAFPQIKEYIMANSRLIGDDYLPLTKIKVYTFEELAQKYGVLEHLKDCYDSEQVLELFSKHVPFKVVISGAPYCFAMELNRENFVHALGRKYLPKQYLSGVPINLPFKSFALVIDNEYYFSGNSRIGIINKLAEAWKLW
jgi:hypothetical protein